MYILIIVPAVLVVLYLFSLHGRTGHKELRRLRKFAYAHRGLHSEGIPENSMAAFRVAWDHGYGIELDVHLLKDGNLAVIHDYSLLRMTDADMAVEDLTAAQLTHYPLKNGETIPLLSQVLKECGGKTPLIVELKSTTGNYAALTDAAVAAMDGYTGAWCMESFDPRCLRHLKKHHGSVIRGQLSENFARSPNSTLPYALKWVMTQLLTNFLTVPDFVAYRFSDRKALSLRICRKLWKIPAVAWTIQNQAEFDRAREEGYLPIFEGFCP